jgi:hypothetical protein
MSSLFANRFGIASSIATALVLFTVLASPISASALTQTYFTNTNWGTGWLTGQIWASGSLYAQNNPDYGIPNEAVTVSLMVKVYYNGVCHYNFDTAGATTGSGGVFGQTWVGPWWVSGQSELDLIFAGDSQYSNTLTPLHVWSYC